MTATERSQSTSPRTTGAGGSRTARTTSCPSTRACRAAARLGRCSSRCCGPTGDGRAARARRRGGERSRAFRFRSSCNAASTTASRRSCRGGSRAHADDRRRRCCARVVLIQAISRMFFLQRSGRIGQDVLLELRRRVFRHFQRLDIGVPRAVHVGPGDLAGRPPTSTRSTSMLETGFDGLVTAVLTLVGTSDPAAHARREARPGRVWRAFPVLVALVWWFRSESAKTYRKVPARASRW